VVWQLEYYSVFSLLRERESKQGVDVCDFVIRYSTGAIGVMKPDDFFAQFELVDEEDA
jgi:hypothetical protein